MSQHTGLPVEGYRPQSRERVDLVNASMALNRSIFQPSRAKLPGDAP